MSGGRQPRLMKVQARSDMLVTLDGPDRLDQTKCPDKN